MNFAGFIMRPPPRQPIPVERLLNERTNAMSWSFTAIAKEKSKLKEHSRKSLLTYHQEGTSGRALMTKVADHIDNLIDLFSLSPGQLIKLETNGHLEGGSGNLKVDLTNYVGTFLE